MSRARETWAKRVERWKKSGLPAAEFARRNKLSEASLKWWKWRLGSRGKAKSAQVSPLTFVEMTAALRREPLELVLDGGVHIRVPAEFDAAALARLLDVLERRR